MRSKRVRHPPFLWAAAAGATFLLYQLVAAVIEELPRLVEGLR